MSQIKGTFRALLKAISKLSISKKKNQKVLHPATERQ